MAKRKDSSGDGDDDKAGSEQPAVLDYVDIDVGIGAMKLTNAPNATISFTVTLPHTADTAARFLPFLAELTRQGRANARFTSAQIRLPDPPKEEELPLDGELSSDPFPAWEKLFAAAEVPVCACPDVAGEDWPSVDTQINDDGTTVEICHQGPCTLATVRISTMDFTEVDDFNRAVVKAKGRKPLPEVDDMPFPAPGDKPDGADEGGDPPSND